MTIEQVAIAEKAQERETEDLESDYGTLKRFVYSNPLTREILYKILKYCRQPRLLDDLEGHILTYPEFMSARQSQYVLIKWLVEQGGLVEDEIDADGAVVDPEHKEGLSEDEIDDLVVDFSYRSSEIGLALVDEMDPKHRLIELLDIVPAHYDTYLELLEFLSEKKSFAKVDTLLRGRSVLTEGRGDQENPLQPSVFIDKLEKAGGIVWKDGWVTTPEGKELRETIEKRVQD